MKKLNVKEPKEKYMLDGYILPDHRLSFEFLLTLKSDDKEKAMRCSTKANTKAEAQRIVELVAASLVREDGWKEHKVLELLEANE